VNHGFRDCEGGAHSGNGCAELISEVARSANEKEQECVGGNMKIEVDERVNQESAARGESGQAESDRKRKALLLQGSKRGKNEQCDKPGAAQASQNSGFGKRFEIVIVRMVDDFSVIESFIRGINELNGAEARA